MEEELKLWKREARKYQQSCANALGDRAYDRVNAEQLASKVGYALYNAPSEINEDNKTASYSKSQQNHIKLVCDKIISQHNESASSSEEKDDYFYISYVYIVIKLRNKKGEEGTQVLFRVPKTLNGKPSTDSNFIDPKPRVYESWEGYLKKNKLPKCDMCYPAEGVYSVIDGSVDIHFGRSPACDTSTAVFTGLDVSSTLLLVGATGVSLASLAVPIATPVVWGAAATVVASGSYETARNMYRLHDIKKHKESLGLKNPDSRSAWLSLAGSFVGMASIGTTAIAKGVVATESAISRAGLLTLRILNVSSLAVSGIGVVNGIITLVMKRINGTLEIADIIHFTTACLFFVNAVVSYHQASLLIDELASSDLTNLFNLRENASYRSTKDIMEFTESSTYNVLRQLVLGLKSRFRPDFELEDLESIVLKLLVLIEQLRKNKTTLDKFAIEAIKQLEKIWKKYEKVIRSVIDEVKNAFEVPYWQNVVPKFAATNLEVPRLMCVEIDRVIEYCGVRSHSSEHRNLMTFARAFSVSHGCKSEKEFVDRFEFYCDCIIAQFREERENYENKLDSQNQLQGFNRDNFDKSYGIEGNKNEFFFNKAMNTVNHPDFLGNIDELYECLPRTNETSGQPPYLSTNRSNIYTFCGSLDQTILDDQFYLDKVAYLTGFDLNCSNSIIQRVDNLVVIQPNSGSFENLESILIHSSFTNQSQMGLILTIMK